MKRLPNIFVTAVFAKKKPHHFRQRPESEEKFRIQSNKIDEQSIKEIFELTDSIEDEGRQEMRVKNKRYPPIAPVIDIARTKVPKTNQEFLNAMSELKPLYDACMKVKTDRELENELRKMRKEKVTVARCSKCGKVFNLPLRDRFCPDDGSFLEIRTVTAEQLEGREHGFPA